MSREQLRAAGLGRGAIEHRLHAGRLLRIHRSVFVVGLAGQPALAAEMAAVLHLGGHAVLSHRSAGKLWGLVDGLGGNITLTVVGHHAHAPAGVKLHRVEIMDRRDVAVRERLPVTTAARTLVDLAAVLAEGELEEVVAAATMRRLVSAAQVRQALNRVPGRKGSARLRRVLRDGLGEGFSRSRAERRMRELVTAAHLPRPQVNAQLCGFTVDFLWPEPRLVVEVDGYDFHGDRVAFERDRRRDQILAAAGFRVIRITWRQLSEEPLAVVARLAQALAPRAA